MRILFNAEIRMVCDLIRIICKEYRVLVMEKETLELESKMVRIRSVAILDDFMCAKFGRLWKSLFSEDEIKNA